MKSKIFEGSAVALVTPFKNNGKQVNYNKLGELIDYHIKNKTDAIVIAGTTGESSTLSTKEHKKVIEFAIKYSDKKIPIIVGTGSNCTKEAIELSKFADKQGADGLLIVTPYYNKCNQKGLFEHYKLIAKNVKTPIILYNVPSRTGVNIEAETTINLSKITNIVGIKEASGNLTQVKKIISSTNKNFSVYSGNDEQISEIINLGGKGVISVLANICPKATHELCISGINKQYNISTSMQIKYLELIKKLFSDVNPIPIKEALNILGYDVGTVRLPLTAIDSERKKDLEKVLIKYKKDNLLY